MADKQLSSAKLGLDIRRALDSFAKKRGFEPALPYYIRGGFNLTTPDGASLYSDEAHLWCKPCADALLAKALPLISADERENHRVFQADVSTGEDSPSHCSACGEALDHVLTKEGVDAELEHYRSHPVKRVSPAQAWCIARIVESAPEDGRVAALGHAAVRAIKAGRVR